MKQTLEIKCELPNLNEIIDGAKKHWSKYADHKKGYDTIISAFARKQLKPITKFPVDVEIQWYCKDRRKDKDNLSAGKKFILDGLIKSNTIPNDNWRVIGNFTDKFFIDKNNPRIIVILRY